MFGKFGAKIEEVLGIVKLIPQFYGDFKATMAVVQHDIADLKAGQAEIRALTGHTATAVTMAAGTAPAPVVVSPTAAPLPPAPTTASGSAGTQSALAKDVAGVEAGIASVIPK